MPNILEILASLYPKDHQVLEEGFFRMLAFDAFIGAPDRHGMNWGVLGPVDGNARPIRFSPIFDTARGLFREYSDEHLIEQVKRQGRKGFLEKYANRSRPIFSSGREKEDNHFSLVRWISVKLETGTGKRFVKCLTQLIYRKSNGCFSDGFVGLSPKIELGLSGIFLHFELIDFSRRFEHEEKLSGSI